MKVTKSLALVATLCLMALVMSGCTRQAWYEGAKHGAENECRNQPPSEMDRCLERLNKKSYEEYKKEREDAK